MHIKNLSKIYKGRYDTVKALDDVTLNFEDHGLVFIVGASGSGKSTLMNMLSGIDKPSSGEVFIGEESLYSSKRGELFGYRNSYVGLIFQDYNLIQDLTVYENIKLPLELLGYTDFSIVDKVMKDIDITEIKDHKVNEISSGQMQRVAIARALVKDSNIILADEPTGNLDTTNGDMVLSILKEVSKKKLVIVITHDDTAAEKFGDRIIQIEDGKILSDSANPPEVDNDVLVTKEPIVTFAKQLEFTRKFMKTFLARSLTIFLLLFLIPIIGTILCGYAFWNVGTSYKSHQDKYNEEYLVLADEKRGYDVYFDDTSYVDMLNEYPSTKFVRVYNLDIPFAGGDTDDLSFGAKGNVTYSKSISHMALYEYGFFDFIWGDEPLEENDVVVTDYIMACLSQYVDEKYDIDLFPDLDYSEQTISLYGVTYHIVGIVDTNYEDFINADFTDEFVYNAFMDNMYIYNSIIIEESNYYNSDNGKSFQERTKYFVDQVAFTSKRHEEMDIKITFYRESAMPQVYKNNMYKSLTGDSKTGRNVVFISDALAKAFGFSNNYSTINGTRTPALTMHDRSRIVTTFSIGGVFKSDDYVMVLADKPFTSSDSFKYMIEKVGNGRLICKKGCADYDTLANEENVVNRSFIYAADLNDTVFSGKITIFEILFTIIVVLIAFGAFINSYTLAQEKKKIGIKYSLGLSRKKIVTPYIIEYVFDIIVGTLSAILVSTIAFPFIMKHIIYRTEYDLNVFSFFYISPLTMIGWCALIAFLMIISLLFMIRKIMKKSPVEIIKDI